MSHTSAAAASKFDPADEGGSMSRLLQFTALVAGILALVSAGYAAGQQSTIRASVRLAALDERELTDAQRELLGDSARSDRTPYLFRVCVRTPDLCRAWIPAHSVPSPKSTASGPVM